MSDELIVNKSETYLRGGLVFVFLNYGKKICNIKCTTLIIFKCTVKNVHFKCTPVSGNKYTHKIAQP